MVLKCGNGRNCGNDMVLPQRSDLVIVMPNIGQKHEISLETNQNMFFLHLNNAANVMQALFLHYAIHYTTASFAIANCHLIISDILRNVQRKKNSFVQWTPFYFIFSSLISKDTHKLRLELGEATK